MSPPLCPACRTDMGPPHPGRLEQSGATHLPADVWTCPRCPEPVTITLHHPGGAYAVNPEYLAALEKERAAKPVAPPAGG